MDTLHNGQTLWLISCFNYRKCSDYDELLMGEMCTQYQLLSCWWHLTYYELTNMIEPINVNSLIPGDAYMRQ